jgi:hypothetical protein
MKYMKAATCILCFISSLFDKDNAAAKIVAKTDIGKKKLILVLNNFKCCMKIINFNF